MRTCRALLLIFFLGGPFLAGLAARAQTSTQSVDDSRLSLTKDVMNEMAGGQISSVCDRFTPDLKDSVTEDKLQFAWNRLIGVSGAFQKQLSQSSRTIHGTTIYVAKSQFEDSKVELRLTFDDKNQITRIWIAPVSDLSLETMESTAKDLVDQLRQKQFEQLTDRFSTELKVRMPPERLEMSWSHVLAHLGEFKNVKLAAKDDELDFVDVTCAFESGEIIVRVAFDPSGKIGGLWMLPVETTPDENPKI
jgi:chemotaxis protein CheY-P-specific phosphatase CheC